MMQYTYSNVRPSRNKKPLVLQRWNTFLLKSFMVHPSPYYIPLILADTITHIYMTVYNAVSNKRDGY